MRMIKLIILFLGLSGIACRYRFLSETSDREKKSENLAESAVLTLLSCYENKVDTVGGIGIKEPSLVKILMTKQPLAVKLFQEVDFTVSRHQTFSRTRPHHKLHLFLVGIAPSKHFSRNVWIAITSQMSGSLATFFVINWPSDKNQKGCSEASSYLWELWKLSILRAFYVCVDKLEDRVFVYTYNPYTSKAPAPWILNKTINGFEDHPWSLFVREYHPGNQQICNNLDFAKTHDLGGYKIKGLFVVTELRFSELTPEYAKTVLSCPLPDLNIAQLAVSTLNATLDLYMASNDGTKFFAGNFKENITQERVINHVDIFLQFWETLNVAEIPLSIILMNTDNVVLTHHAGVKSQLDKLIGVFDRATRLGICLVIIGTVLFFKFFMGQPIGTAMMNVIRIIGNTGLLRVPNRNAPRLYLAGVFILVVTIVGVYQGLLAALLTKQTLLPEIDTLEDLANSPHTIHVIDPHLFEISFKDPRFKDRLTTVVGRCQPYVGAKIVINPSDACLRPRNHLIHHAIEQNLHISRDVIVPGYASYRIKWNWALEERFNEILRSFDESGVYWIVYKRDLQRQIDIAEYKEALEIDRPVVMTLSNLGFAFAFLGIGLSLATIVLVIEIAMKRRELGQRIRLIRKVRSNNKVSVSMRASEKA